MLQQRNVELEVRGKPFVQLGKIIESLNDVPYL